MLRLSVFLFLFLLLVPYSLAAPNRTYPGFQPSRTCDASLGQCDSPMDSEINRRILATTSYISYGSLTADRVPCSSSGTSYYNCGASGAANPYTRGCSKITQCARDTG